MFVLHQVVRQSDKDVVTVIGAGVTLHEALAAADTLASEGALILPSSGGMYAVQVIKYISYQRVKKIKHDSQSLKRDVFFCCLLNCYR